MANSPPLAAVLELLQKSEVNIADLLLFLLQTPSLETCVAVKQLSEKAGAVLTACVEHPVTSQAFSTHMQTAVKEKLVASVKELSKKDQGWHFSALRATPEKLAEFQLEEMSLGMREAAPELWEMIGFMLGSTQPTVDVATNVDNDEEQYWLAEDDIADLLGNNDAAAHGNQRRARSKEEHDAWRHSLISIKTTVVISIMMQSVNQQCNALQSIVGIFLHSTDTPEKVIKTLGRMGVSISVQAVNYAIKSLSAASAKGLQELGRSLLASYAYDNFDIQLNVSTPTVEDGGSGLIHLTSGDLLQLDHGVTTEDLRCSKELWENSPYNDHAMRPTYPDFVSLQSTAHLRKLHPETRDEFGQTRRDRFNTWRFLYDLCEHGPDYFHQFRDKIGAPETVEQIPVTKLRHLPARAMDINQSKVSGNLEAIANLLHQGGVGDPNDEEDAEYALDVVDMSEYVMLVHGDLSTYERVQSVMDRRADEDTPWRRYQYVVFVLGLFHLKMAAADAIWRIFISTASAKKDLNCLMAFVGVLRASETGKIGSKPKFRQMHEVTQHVGIVLRLDAWRVALKRRNKKYASLEDFAATKPSFEELQEIARNVSSNFVAGEVTDLFEARLNSDAERDKQLENTTLLQQYFLLYEELTYAMNAGDIGCVETLFPPWINIFRGCGKHKYATQMTRFLTDVHYRYPPGLRRAIRYNMLVNPTGRLGQFRGVDWVVELNNLFTKDTYGGSGSNYNKERIITESPLILIYRNCHANIEKNFKLGGLSSAHATKDMRQSFKALAKYMKENGTNDYKAARNTEHEIHDMLDEGLAVEHKMGHLADQGENDDIEEGWEDITADDLSVEAPL